MAEEGEGAECSIVYRRRRHRSPLARSARRAATAAPGSRGERVNDSICHTARRRRAGATLVPPLVLVPRWSMSGCCTLGRRTIAGL